MVAPLASAVATQFLAEQAFLPQQLAAVAAVITPQRRVKMVDQGAVVREVLEHLTQAAQVRQDREITAARATKVPLTMGQAVAVARVRLVVMELLLPAVMVARV
jgi:hypothetical protein